MSENINEFLSVDNINRIAKESGFIQRALSNKLKPAEFIDVLLTSYAGGKQQSLNAIAFTLATKHGIEISKQGVDARFNQLAVKFFRGVLEQVLNGMIKGADNEIRFLSVFTSVRIKDSTCFQLPKELAYLYPGSGGAGSKASVRIQFEFDFKTGKIFDLTIGPFNVADQTNATNTIDDINPGDLIIRDLGYVNHESTDGIDKRNAWYLNRLRSGDNVYKMKEDGSFEQVDFKKLYNYLKKNKINQTEIEVYITDKKDIMTRLIIEVVPDDVYEKRISKAGREAKKKGRQLSQEYKSRARLNLFITNVQEEVLETKNVRTLYRIRWQVELIFKSWKQTMKIENVKKMKVERFESILLLKLVWLTMNWGIIWELTKYVWENEGFILSIQKSYACLGEIRAVVMLIILQQNQNELEGTIQEIFSQRKKLRLEGKKNSLTLEKLIMTYNTK